MNIYFPCQRYCLVSNRLALLCFDRRIVMFIPDTFYQQLPIRVVADVIIKGNVVFLCGWLDTVTPVQNVFVIGF